MNLTTDPALHEPAIRWSGQPRARFGYAARDTFWDLTLMSKGIPALKRDQPNRLPAMLKSIMQIFSAPRLWKTAVLVLFAVLIAGSVRAANPIVERVSFAARADGLGYVVRIHTTGRIQAYSEPRRLSGDVLELILFNTGISPDFQHDPAQGPVGDYSLETSEHHTYLHFHLNLKDVEARAYRDGKSNDLLLSVSASGDRAPESVEVAAGARERWRLDTVVIDAGHGGRDPGSIGYRGLREKDVVLAVAKKLGGYLHDLLGIKVVYTRRSDRFVPLKERGRIGNEAGGKLFISIHANASPARSARGTETYFLGIHKSEQAQEVMEKENSVIRFETDQEHYQTFDENDLIRMQLAQSGYMRQSEMLAGLVEKQFDERVGRRSRGVKQAGFYVLWSASMPALLVELGFLSNPREAAFLRSKDGQAYMASAIFRAVKKFKNEYEKGLHLVSSQ